MRTRPHGPPTCGLILGLLTALAVGAAARAANLEVAIEPRFGGLPLAINESVVSAAGWQFSVDRLDALLSNFTLASRSEAGPAALTNQFAFFSAAQGRRSFVLTNIPPGAFTALRFQVGLPPAINHADPADYGPSHPLNPSVDGMHWNWQGGYVFLAFEGHWLKTNGFSYHLATDQRLCQVEVPCPLPLTSDLRLTLAFNVDQLFEGRNRIGISRETASTHSRSGDALAVGLSENLGNAFAVVRVESQLHPGAISTSRRVEMAPGATPYRFRFSKLFPQPLLPRDNPLTREGVALGDSLFHDPALSINRSQSCASCHRAAAAFSDAGRRFSLGAEGQAGSRNAMPLANLAWQKTFFWDGRAPSLREQVLLPIQNPVEMHGSLPEVVARLAAAGYAPAFADAFGTPEISADRIARALEQYVLTLVSCDSKFDRVARGGETFSAEEQRGFDLFHTEYDPRHGQDGADCFHCHGGPLFSDFAFHNNGLELETAASDLGRFNVTSNRFDRGKFKTPSLRNVAVTGPYMHDGRFKTLDEAVAHYVTGVRRSDTLDPNLAKHPDGGVPLSVDDQRALVAFLKTLTDRAFELPANLVADHAL